MPTVMLSGAAPLIHMRKLFGHASPPSFPRLNPVSIVTYISPEGSRKPTGKATLVHRSAKGEIAAMHAATLLGEPASVADVIVMLRQAGLSPPRLPPEQERAELERARRIFGWA